MNATKKRRKQLVSDREVQGGLFRRLSGQWLLLLLANGLGLAFWVRLYEMPDASWQTTLEEAFARYLPFLIVSFSLLPAFAWDINRTTNRFAGPIGRLRTALADAARGKKVAPLTFRSNDYWTSIARDFNQLVDRRTSPDNEQIAS